MDAPRTVFIVLPAYEEAAGLPDLLAALQAGMTASGESYCVVVIDDGSRDATADIAERCAHDMPLRLIRHAVNQGLGASLRDGLDAALAHAGNHDVIVTMDADDTHPPATITPMLALVDAGCDVVIASRFRAGAQVVGVPAGRRALSRGASWLMRLAVPIRGVRDFTCGFRAYRVAALRRAIDAHGGLIAQDGFSCMVDLLLRLRPLPLTFAEVPLELRYDRKRGRSKMAVARTTGSTLRVLARHLMRPAATSA